MIFRLFVLDLCMRRYSLQVNYRMVSITLEKYCNEGLTPRQTDDASSSFFHVSLKIARMISTGSVEQMGIRAGDIVWMDTMMTRQSRNQERIWTRTLRTSRALR